jgi:anti-repressor protein
MQLVKISKSEINGATIDSVDARELHAFLESKQRFADWIKGRINQYGFTQGVDFVANHSSMTSPPRIEYVVSIDMAKELAMVERNQKGREVRQYFLECERRAKESSQAPQFQIPQTLPEALRLAAQLAEEKQQALEVIKQKDQLIVAVADLNIKAGQVSIAEFAKNLAISGMGQNNVYKWLKGRGFLQINNQPYQQYVERGYFVMKPYDEKIKGEVKYKTMLTPKGTAWLSKMLHAEFELGESA